MMVRTAFVLAPEPVRFRVDRPFLVLIRHAPSGALYFLARVTRP
jgi:serpin B